MKGVYYGAWVCSVSEVPTHSLNSEETIHLSVTSNDAWISYNLRKLLFYKMQHVCMHICLCEKTTY